MAKAKRSKLEGKNEIARLSTVLHNHGIWKDSETWNNIVQDEIKRSVGDEKECDMNKLVKKASKATVLRILRKLADYSILLKVESNIVIDVIKKWGRFCDINSKFIRELIIEIKTYQPMGKGASVGIPTHIHLRKMHAMRLKCKCSGKLIALTQSLKYLGARRELLHILLLSKSVSEVLKLEVYKQVLLRTHLKYSDPQRLSIWKSLLLAVTL